MRDLTKSMFSFSWAMSMFGVQQVSNILSPSNAVKSLNNITDATKRELDGVTEATFRAVDSLQKGLVDATFGVVSPRIFNPNTWIKLTSDVAQRTLGALGQVSGASGAQSQATGWGPVPPVNKNDAVT